MSENKNSIIVDGFSFVSEAEAAQAQKEVEGIAYIRDKVEMDNPQMVLQIYNGMVQQGLFETAVGYTYLKELQGYLITIPYINQEEILPVPVVHPAFLAEAERKTALKETPAKKKESSVKKRETPGRKRQLGKKRPNKNNVSSKRKETRKAAPAGWELRARIMTVISIVLAVCVVGMFVIQMTSGSTNILNYENKIIDKYEQWEQELEEREAALTQRERESGNSGREE